MTDQTTVDDLLGRLGRDELPWDKAWVADFGEFDSRYTLHDSFWVGVFLAVRGGNEAVLILEWDAYWLPEPLHGECRDEPSVPPHFGRPILLIRVSNVSAIRLSGYEQAMSTRDISSTEYRVEREVGRLTLVDSVGGATALDFVGPAEFLAISTHDGRVLELAKAEPRQETGQEQRPWWRFW